MKRERVEKMSLNEDALKMHKENEGKIEVISKVPVKTKMDLSLAYTPGVAEPCRHIHKDTQKVYDYTSRGNLVAVVSDGTAVLGLGNIGPEAALPVMEGKSVLFKTFGGVDAFPICLDTTDPDEIIRTVSLLVPTFGGINLEDIAAPNCFYIEQELKKRLDIPVFHDDQHGTAVVVMAGLMNALKVVNKKMEQITVVVNGAGSAGIAITKLLLKAGAGDVILCDKEGALFEGAEYMNPRQAEMASITNKHQQKGALSDILKGSDVFIGVSAPGIVTQDMVASMATDAIVFAMANPTPEIMPDLALTGGARVVGTGRSDFPNQVNNVLAFPGIFRGALDVRASDINEEMKIAAARAISELILPEELNEEYVIPNSLDKRVVPKVAMAVAQAAQRSGVAQLDYTEEEIQERMRKFLPEE